MTCTSGCCLHSLNGGGRRAGGDSCLFFDSLSSGPARGAASMIWGHGQYTGSVIPAMHHKKQPLLFIAEEGAIRGPSLNTLYERAMQDPVQSQNECIS